jgi:pimeloyl-ACP methyl ester carboxylesterase
VLGESALALLREDQLPVGDDVVLTLVPGDGLRLVRSALVQRGRETRSPAVITVSDGAVEDLDLHANEPTRALGWRSSGAAADGQSKTGPGSVDCAITRLQDSAGSSVKPGRAQMSSTASKPPIVLIHGMWMTPLSWEHWASHYTDRGHRVLAPAWPGLDSEPEALRRDPAPLRGIDITEVVDHYDRVIRGLDQAPIIIGHSFGGLFAQLLLDRGLGVAGVALDTAAPKGVLKLPFSTIRSAWPALGNPANLKKECGQQGRVRPGLRPLLHPGERTAVLPGGPRQLQPERQDEGQLQEPRTSAASAHHGRHRSDLSAVGEPCNLQATAEGALCHRPQGVPGPLSLAGPGRLGGSRGLRAQLGDRARTHRRRRVCRGTRTDHDLTCLIDGGLHHHPDPDRRLRDVEADVRPGSSVRSTIRITSSSSSSSTLADAEEARSRLEESGVLDRFEDKDGPNVLEEAPE